MKLKIIFLILYSMYRAVTSSLTPGIVLGFCKYNPWLLSQEIKENRTKTPSYMLNLPGTLKSQRQPCIAINGDRLGVLPYKSDGSAHPKISRTPLKGTRILFNGRVPNSFPPLRGTNSTINKTNYITVTANFNSNKDNFRTLSSQGLFESIVKNVYPNQSFQVLAP